MCNDNAGIISAVIQVEGMACEHCVKAVHDALAALNGVQSVRVDLAAGRAEVSYDQSVLDEAALADAIEQVGFDVRK